MSKLLYVAPLFETECGYLLNSIKTEFEIKSLKGAWRNFIENEIPGMFPGSAQELKEFNVIVFSDVGRKNFADQQLQAVRDYVAGGGSFLMIGGYASFAGYELMGNYHATAIADILPVRISDKPDVINVPRGFFAQAVNLNHPIMRYIDWSNTPVAVGYNRVTAKDSTEVLLSYQGHPILVVGAYEKGRSAAFMTDAHPHWSGGWTDWQYYPIFWRNVFNWLCRNI